MPTSVDTVEDMPQPVCPYQVRNNLRRFAQRHALRELQSVTETTKYAGYTNFDEVDIPTSDFI